MKLRYVAEGSIGFTAIVATFAVFWFGTPAYAGDKQNQPKAEMTSEVKLLAGGLICDTHEQAVVAIMNPTVVSDGCGILRGKAVLGTITALEPFEFNGHAYLMARYDFVVPTPWGNQVQYGFWGKPIPTAASLEPSSYEDDV